MKKIILTLKNIIIYILMTLITFYFVFYMNNMLREKRNIKYDLNNTNMTELQKVNFKKIKDELQDYFK